MKQQVMTVGMRAKFLRVMSGMTQEELGNESHWLSPNRIARIEQGRLEPSAEVHGALAAIFNTLPAWTRDGVPPAFDQIGYFQLYPDSIFSIFSGKAIVRKMETLDEAFERFFPMFIEENGISEYSVVSDPDSTEDYEYHDIDKVYLFYVPSPDQKHNAVLVLSAFDMSYDVVEAVIDKTPLKKIKEINVDSQMFSNLRSKNVKHSLALFHILNELGGWKQLGF